MKKEYDFSKAEQGKFYRANSELEIPVYLDKELAEFFNKIAKEKKTNISKLVNKILLKELEIYQSFTGKKYQK